MLVLLDVSISGFLKVFVSLSFLSVFVAELGYPYSLFFAFASGITFDIFFASFIGQFSFFIFLITMLLQTIKTFYAIKREALALLFLTLFFGMTYTFSRNAHTIYFYFIFTAILTPVWFPLSNFWNRLALYEKE